tara:strand:- start:569 stop:4549 length:3981 start_codon:yes stop_codon:yes gene_type:complete
MAITFVSWRLIQTERFGALISGRISKIASEQVGLELKFNKVELDLFPISTRLKNVSIEKDNYEVKAGEIALEFGLRDLFAKTFSIGRIVIRDSVISLPEIKKSEEKEEFNLEKYFEQYQNYVFDEAPFRLRGVKLINSNIVYDGKLSSIYSFDLNFYKNIITTRLNASTEKEFVTNIIKQNITLPDFDGVKASLQITKDNIRVKELRIFSETSFVNIATKLNAKGEVGQGLLTGFLELKKVKELIPKDSVNEQLLPAGGVEFEVDFSKVDNNPVFSGTFTGKNFYSGFYRLDEVSGNIESDGNYLSLSELKGVVKNGEATVKNKVTLFDWKTKKAINPKFELELKNLYSNHFLFFVKGLDSAKFSATGKLGVEFFNDHVSLEARDNVTLKNFKLMTVSGTQEIVGNELVRIQNQGKIDIQFNGQVNFNTFALFKNSKLGIFGFVNGDEVQVDVGKSWIDFEELGPIVGTQILGKGDVLGKIRGPLDNVVFDLKMSQSGFQVIDFNLGKITGNMKYYLASQKMELTRISGQYESIEYLADGNLIFDSNETNQLDLRVNIEKGTLDDARIALAPVVNPLKEYLKKVNFNFSSQLLLRGKMNVPQMRVKGHLETSSLMINSEDVDTAVGDFSLENNVIRFEKVRAKKVSGRLEGEGFYNLGSKEFTYRFSLSSLRLKDILYYRLMSLGLDGEAFGEFYGVGEGDNFSSRSHVRVTNSSIENYKLNDSVLTVYNNNSDLFFSGTLIGGDANLEGYLNLNENNKDKLSSVTAKVNSDDVRILAGIFSQHNIFNKDLVGHFESTIQADFDIFKKETLDLVASLDRAELHYAGIDFKLKKRPTIVEIDNGKFKNWNYHFVGKGVDIRSVGEGIIGEDFRLIHQFELDSSVLELVNDKIENSYGKIKGEHVISSNGSVKNFLSLSGEDLSLKAKKLPGLITDLKLDISMDNNQLVINTLKGSYGNGEILGTGVVVLKFPFPEINLKLSIEKARYPLFKKSGVVLSGDLTFKGKKLPYDLSGDLAIISGEIIEETNDLASSAINNDSYQRYIPVGYLEGNVSFMKNNIRLVSFDPIRIKNSMMSLGLLGNMKIFGTLSNPKFNGDLSLSNSENKFLFKGHEFLLSEGVIHFVDGARKESPELRFSGTAKINEYDVYINLNGPADSLVVEMSSNPPLIQEDILSLLTLGVTSDVSKNLGERQRQSVTTLSIGSLIMDQLKINQSLNDSLGLRLSVQPEFEEDETTLLEGKVDDSSANSRLRSATVVKVQKRINKNVNLSVSSTVGGNIDQSQEMNINYKINKSWSLEGVYEVKSNDELEQQIPDSVGADVKYQWSF